MFWRRKRQEPQDPNPLLTMSEAEFNRALQQSADDFAVRVAADGLKHMIYHAAMFPSGSSSRQVAMEMLRVEYIRVKEAHPQIDEYLNDPATVQVIQALKG